MTRMLEHLLARCDRLTAAEVEVMVAAHIPPGEGVLRAANQLAAQHSIVDPVMAASQEAQRVLMNRVLILGRAEPEAPGEDMLTPQRPRAMPAVWSAVKLAGEAAIAMSLHEHEALASTDYARIWDPLIVSWVRALTAFAHLEATCTASL